jgi:hypothetical protein
MRVAFGHPERGRGDVGRDDSRRRKLDGERHGQASASGSDIDDAVRERARRDRQSLLDDQLGLGPRNEHVARDLDVESPELAVADDIGRGFARRTPGHEWREEAIEGRR